jgi:transcription elongation factor Elf1
LKIYQNPGEYQEIPTDQVEELAQGSIEIKTADALYSVVEVKDELILDEDMNEFLEFNNQEDQLSRMESEEDFTLPELSAFEEIETQYNCPQPSTSQTVKNVIHPPKAGKTPQFICSNCHRPLGSIKALIRHMKQCYAYNNMDKIRKPFNKKTKEIFECPVCNATYESERALNNHQKIHVAKVTLK